MDFKELIKLKFESMSKSQKKVAKYLLDNFDKVIFDTARQLSEKIGVSEATVIRFSYVLGFKSFAEMHREMEKNVVNSPEEIDMNLGNDIGKFAARQAMGLEGSYSKINFDEFKRVCELIMTKKRVLIIGFMDSFGVSSELMHQLDSIRNRVYFSKLLYEDKQTLLDMDESAVALVVSFAPHYKYTKEQAETVKGYGCTIVTLTDSELSPFMDMSDHTIVIDVKRKGEVVDMSPVMSFIFFMACYLRENYADSIDEYIKNEKRFEAFIE